MPESVSAPAPDLDAFRRIHYTGSREPALATLRALRLHHVQAIPGTRFNRPNAVWPV